MKLIKYFGEVYMTLRSKSLANIEAVDFDGLVENAIEEGIHLDFKRAMIGGTSDDRKKFLADVCSFANAHGGDLVLGIQENDEGTAIAVTPLVFNPDEEILRLENMISDGLDPKLFGVRIRSVPHGAGHVLVIRVPKSVSGMHRSKADQHFYVRQSRSNRQLDVAAIRTRFEGELTRQTRLEEYLAQRYAALLSDSTVLPMMPGPKCVVHIFPALRGFDDVQFDISAVADVGNFPIPTRPGGLDCRMSYEGPMHHSPIANGRIRAFSLVHHFGIVEGVWKVADPLGADTVIAAEQTERYILDFVADAVQIMRQRLAVELPLLVRIALVDGAEATIRPTNQAQFAADRDLLLSRVGRAALILPDVLIAEWPVLNPDVLFLPTFDRLWQTSGHARSLTYRYQDGQWRRLG